MYRYTTCSYIYVIRPEKTGLNYLHKIYLFILWCIFPFLCMLSKFCSFIEFLRSLCIYDEICVKMLCCEVEILATFQRLKFRSNFT